MESLRAAIEQGLYASIEGEWGMAVELTSPAGITQTMSKNNPLESLKGQVLYFSRRENPATGEVIIINQPVVSLRISSLDRVPISGERWFIKMPISAVAAAAMRTFV